MIYHKWLHIINTTSFSNEKDQNMVWVITRQDSTKESSEEPTSEQGLQWFLTKHVSMPPTDLG